jgi:hypothetical protein
MGTRREPEGDRTNKRVQSKEKQSQRKEDIKGDKTRNEKVSPLLFLKVPSSLQIHPAYSQYSPFYNMSSTGFTELVQPTSAPSTPTSSIISPPENTPINNTTPKRLLTLQLAIRLLPIEEDVLSSVNYEQEAKQGNPDDPPSGFIVNDPDSHHYYPVYIPNPMYGNWDKQDRTKVAQYIQYHPDYMYVTGTEGQGYSRCTIPIYIGRQTSRYTPMTSSKWKEFARGAPQEFIINEAVAEMGDPRIIGEVNRYRGKRDPKDTLDKLLRDMRQRINEISKEALAVENELVDSMARIEHTNLHTLVHCQLRLAFPLPTPIHPIRPITHSPKLTPIVPCTKGPAEMPVLMDGNLCQVKCYRCKLWGHKAQECPKKKVKECRLCGNTTHKKARCPYRRPLKVEVTVESEKRVNIGDVGQMSLLDRINLLDHPSWTPQVCSKCGQKNPGHIEVECPQYEYCHWCKTSGSYGFRQRHACGMWEDEVMSNADDNIKHDMWYNNK